jgi:hypothetical protein
MAVADFLLEDRPLHPVAMVVAQGSVLTAGLASHSGTTDTETITILIPLRSIMTPIPTPSQPDIIRWPTLPTGGLLWKTRQNLETLALWKIDQSS